MRQSNRYWQCKFLVISLLVSLLLCSCGSEKNSIHPKKPSKTSTEIANSKKKDYLNKIRIMSNEVGYHDNFGMKNVGISNISIKNEGDEDIGYIEITLFWQDEKYNDIASEKIYPLTMNIDDIPAGFLWKMDDNTYYKITNIPEGVDITRYRLEITDIEFSDDCVF